MDSFHLEYEGKPFAQEQPTPVVEVGAPAGIDTHAAIEVGELTPLQATGIVVLLTVPVVLGHVFRNKKPHDK